MEKHQVITCFPIPSVSLRHVVQLIKYQRTLKVPARKLHRFISVVWRWKTAIGLHFTKKFPTDPKQKSTGTSASNPILHVEQSSTTDQLSSCACFSHGPSPRADALHALFTTATFKCGKSKLCLFKSTLMTFHLP